MPTPEPPYHQSAASEGAGVKAAPHPHSRIAALAERVAQLERELEEANDRALRAMADLENYKRRARQEMEEALELGKSTVLLEMFPIMDDLQRVANSAAEKHSLKAILSGVELIERRFLQNLKHLGVKQIEAQGKPFDPLYHEAMGEVPTSEYPEGMVVVEISRGYLMGDRMLRPSRVLVARRPVEGEQGPPIIER